MAASPTEMSLLALMPTPCKPVSGVELETWVRLVRSDFDFNIFLWKKVTHTEFLSFVWCSQIFTSFLGIFFIFFQSGLAQMRRWWKLMFLSWGSVRSVTLQWLSAKNLMTCQSGRKVMDMKSWKTSTPSWKMCDLSGIPFTLGNLVSWGFQSFVSAVGKGWTYQKRDGRIVGAHKQEIQQNWSGRMIVSDLFGSNHYLQSCQIHAFFGDLLGWLDSIYLFEVIEFRFLKVVSKFRFSPFWRLV